MAYYTRIWDVPVPQMRRELAQHTDAALARHYGVSRASVWRLRRSLGVCPHPMGWPLGRPRSPFLHED